jgi:hypothetical protein
MNTAHTSSEVKRTPPAAVCNFEQPQILAQPRSVIEKLGFKDVQQFQNLTWRQARELIGSAYDAMPEPDQRMLHLAHLVLRHQLPPDSRPIVPTGAHLSSEQYKRAKAFLDDYVMVDYPALAIANDPKKLDQLVKLEQEWVVPDANFKLNIPTPGLMAARNRAELVEFLRQPGAQVQLIESKADGEIQFLRYYNMNARTAGPDDQDSTNAGICALERVMPKEMVAALKIGAEDLVVGKHSFIQKCEDAGCPGIGARLIDVASLQEMHEAGVDVSFGAVRLFPAANEHARRHHIRQGWIPTGVVVDRPLTLGDGQTIVVKYEAMVRDIEEALEENSDLLEASPIEIRDLDHGQ